ncbi:hypothetical protein AALA99_13790 [Anaerotruncus colihominis]|uniref:hypothetical protein n=1 Tax=Anaerotruncus colihominis TaxID=169435 RepID=UPI003515D659
MSNPFFSAMGGENLSSPMGNMMGMMQQFNEFRQSFQGDPKAKVQELLNSGQMSQTQFNELQGMARAFQQMLGK